MSLLWKLGTATSLRNVDKKNMTFWAAIVPIVFGSFTRALCQLFWVLHKSTHVLGKLLLVIWGPSMTHMPRVGNSCGQHNDSPTMQ